jgi:hypothetical protein
MANFNVGEFIRSVFEDAKQRNRCGNLSNWLNSNGKFVYFYCEGVVHAFVNVSIQRELRCEKHVVSFENFFRVFFGPTFLREIREKKFFGF